jgi:hypothetical protein
MKEADECTALYVLAQDPDSDRFSCAEKLSVILRDVEGSTLMLEHFLVRMDNGRFFLEIRLAHCLRPGPSTASNALEDVSVRAYANITAIIIADRSTTFQTKWLWLPRQSARK